MTNRIGPIPPESNRPPHTERTSKTAPGEHKRIEEVSEVDEEQKRRKFQKSMEEVEETEEEIKPRLPNPFQPSFHTTKVSSVSKKEMEDLEENIIPSPSYSQPPPKDLGKKGKGEKEEGSLPQSSEFWKEIDEPPDRPLGPKNFQEHADGKESKKAKELPAPPFLSTPPKMKGKTEEESEEISEFVKKKKNSERPSPRESENLGQPRFSHKEEGEERFSKKINSQNSPFEPPISERGDKKRDPSLRFDQKEEQNTKAQWWEVEEPLEKREKGKIDRPREGYEEKESFSENLKGNSKNKQDAERLPLPPTHRFASSEAAEETESKPSFSPISNQKSDEFVEENYITQMKEEKREREQKISEWTERSKKDERGKKKQQIEANIMPVIPIEAIPFAQAAMTQTSHYLNPATYALFYQMVGTIFVMTATRGITKTEIHLNSPAFAKSKFYGSTITIEKYETAPDSLNIRLVGTGDAVTEFNENLPALMNAFKKGGFSFRIGRIEAEYQSDRTEPKG